MPKFIVSQDLMVLNESAFKNLLPILGRLEKNEILSNWASEEIEQLNFFTEQLPVGGLLTTHIAQGFITNFTNHHGSSVTATVTKDVVMTFLKECTDMFNASSRYPATHDLALRFYIGMDATGTYSFVIVPAYSPNDIQPGRLPHQDDLEKTAFEENNTAFFALVADASGAFIERSLSSARDRIVTKDASKKELVFFSQANLVKFFRGFTKPNDFTTMHLTLARETNTSNGPLGLVLHCLKNGSPLTSRVSGWPVNTGIYFDQGDLIPPPPPAEGDPIDDTSF